MAPSSSSSSSATAAACREGLRIYMGGGDDGLGWLGEIFCSVFRITSGKPCWALVNERNARGCITFRSFSNYKGRASKMVRAYVFVCAYARDGSGSGGHEPAGVSQTSSSRHQSTFLPGLHKAEAMYLVNRLCRGADPRRYAQHHKGQLEIHGAAYRALSHLAVWCTRRLNASAPRSREKGTVRASPANASSTKKKK